MTTPSVYSANLDLGFGLKPMRQTSGGSYARRETFTLPPNYNVPVFRGDLLKFSGKSDATGKYQEVEVWKKGDTERICGVAAGFAPEKSPDQAQNHAGFYVDAPNMKYLQADVPGTFHIQAVTDPDCEFLMHVDGATLTPADFGQNADVTARAPMHLTSYPIPGFSLDASTCATTETLPLRLLRGHNNIANLALEPFAEVVVMINRHARKSSQPGV